MIFTPTPIEGAFEIRLQRLSDHRGHFARAWCAEEFREQRLNPRAAELNVGFSHLRGTLRGLHYQADPHAETKFVRCTRGAVFDVVVDLRPGSPTFCHWYAVELTADNDTMLFVPEGCAHGYQTLVDHTEIEYLASAAYAPSAARGVRYDDPAFGIEWPLAISAISHADATWPAFPFSSRPTTV